MKKIAMILVVLCLIQSNNNSYAVNISETAKQVVQGVIKSTKYVTHRIQLKSIKQGLFYTGCALVFVCGALQLYFGCEQLYSLTKDAYGLKHENKKNSIDNQFKSRDINELEDDKDDKNS
jgi:hypothetical protein